MSDIQDLLARLQSTPSQQPSLSSGLFSNATPKQSSSPHPDQAPRDGSASDRTTNLLNLLKFNKPTTSQDRPSSQRAPSADAQAALSQSRPQSGHASGSRNQNLLLDLLNNKAAATQPAPSQLMIGHVDESKPIQAPQPQSMAPFSFVGPFEQLAASSSARSPQPDAESVSKTNGNTGARDSPIPTDQGRTRLEALLGIGRADSTDSKSAPVANTTLVADSAPASQVLEKKLPTANDSTAAPAPVIGDEREIKTPRGAVRSAVHNDLAKPVEAKTPALATTIAAVENASTSAKNGASEAAAESWESADATEGAEGDKDREYRPVIVYNFPMKPFVSIDVLPAGITTSTLREEAIMKIATFKKGFDQVDRTLATASGNFIVYALAKGGGARAIHQEMGENKPAFRGTGNAVFNLSLSAPKSSPLSSESEHLLLTATNGSVFWTSLPVDQETFESADLDKRGFVFPPPSAGDDATSTSQLKTRAKKSSRHPEFFAIGRGKSIYLIYPKVALTADYYDAKTGVVNSDKYLSERRLRISTGKAGKDFAFSEDDTCLVSLDKSGKLKFWDIIGHTSLNHAAPTGPRPAKDIEDPIWTLNVSINSDKASPTSIQFLDKDKPMVRGTALRYLLVGFKQNHTIQLWDLGLGKAVQEINLPHENDTDAICSIAYNAKSGIVTIGHPTRNSIFMIHLSAPKYNLDTMSQANYITRLSKGDRTLPRPESTAIMSGLREISFSSIGQLRSLDITTPGLAPIDKVDAADEALFELYTMHSRGVTCLTIRREDVGWREDGKTINPVDAQTSGVIAISDLRLVADSEQASEQAHQKSTSAKSPAKSELPASQGRPVATVSTPSKASALTSVAQANGDARSDKKKPKRRTDEAADAKLSANDLAEPRVSASSDASAPPPAAPSAPSAPAVLPKHVPTPVPATSAQPPKADEPTQQTASNQSGTMEAGSRVDVAAAVTDALANSLTLHFDRLYRRMNDDKRVQEAVGTANQEAILRLVSSSLGDNVERTLNRIISTNIQESVTPAAANAATSSIDARLMELVPPHLNSVLPREIKSSLRGALTTALQSKEVLTAIADHMKVQVSSKIQDDLKDAHVRIELSPIVDRLLEKTHEAVGSEIRTRLQEQLRPLELARQRDAAAIEELTNNTRRLLQTVEHLAASHGALHQEIVNLRAQMSSQQQNSSGPHAQGHAPSGQLPRAERDEELDTIAHLMNEGSREEAMIKWLQSSRQSELFDKYFVRFQPDFLPSLSMIVLLSVTMAVAASLKTNIAPRLQWISVILDTIDVENPDVGQYAPRLLEVLNDKLQDAYMDLSAESPPAGGTLQRIRQLIHRAREIKAAI